MYRILVNECLNILRARSRVSEEIGSAAETEDGPFETLARTERHRRIQAALMALSPEYREVVVLRHFAGLSYDEIADSVGVPAKTVKSRLYSARQQLGELLLDWEPGT
jgi:RNA polymerase sigma-70 factor (ECF subfamily)